MKVDVAARGPVGLDVQGFARLPQGDTLVTRDWPTKATDLASVTFLKADDVEAEAPDGDRSSFDGEDERGLGLAPEDDLDGRIQELPACLGCQLLHFRWFHPASRVEGNHLPSCLPELPQDR